MTGISITKRLYPVKSLINLLKTLADKSEIEVLFHFYSFSEKLEPQGPQWDYVKARAAASLLLVLRRRWEGGRL